jgi:hypothetical protein
MVLKRWRTSDEVLHLDANNLIICDTDKRTIFVQKMPTGLCESFFILRKKSSVKTQIGSLDTLVFQPHSVDRFST